MALVQAGSVARLEPGIGALCAGRRRGRGRAAAAPLHAVAAPVVVRRLRERAASRSRRPGRGRRGGRWRVVRGAAVPAAPGDTGAGDDRADAPRRASDRGARGRGALRPARRSSRSRCSSRRRCGRGPRATCSSARRSRATGTPQGTVNAAVHGLQPDRAAGAPRDVPAARLRRQRARVGARAGSGGAGPGGRSGVAPCGRPGSPRRRSCCWLRSPGCWWTAAWCGPSPRVRRSPPGIAYPAIAPLVGALGFVHHRVDDELERAVLVPAGRRRAPDRRPPGRPAGRPARRRQHRQLARARGDPARPQRRGCGALGGARCCG